MPRHSKILCETSSSDVSTTGIVLFIRDDHHSAQVMVNLHRSLPRIETGFHMTKLNRLPIPSMVKGN